MTYLNGVRTSDLSHIVITVVGTTGTVTAYPTAASGLSSFGLGSYTSAPDLQTALSSFIEDVGAPWVAVGSPSNISWVNGEEGILAVNMDQSQEVTVSDGASGYFHSGIKFGLYPQPSYGYNPWDSYADAASALADMVQASVTWAPSS